MEFFIKKRPPPSNYKKTVCDINKKLMIDNASASTTGKDKNG